MNTRAVATSAAWRTVAAAMTTIAGASALLLLALLMLSSEGVNPLRLIRLFTNLVLVPRAVAWLIARTFSVSLAVDRDGLVLDGRNRRVEVPLPSISGISPWIVPVPGGGMWLRLKSGRRLRYGLQVADPVALVERLADAGAPSVVRSAALHPTLLYQRSKNAAARRWYHPLLKFVVFALVPALPLWRVHQYIAYGGTFGEYYQYGLKAYVLGFAVYWATLIVYLVLYAAVLRAVTELAALAAAWVAPSREARVRRAAEIGNRILYYGGVPVSLVLRFWPW